MTGGPVSTAVVLVVADLGTLRDVGMLCSESGWRVGPEALGGSHPDSEAQPQVQPRPLAFFLLEKQQVLAPGLLSLREGAGINTDSQQ